MKSTKTCLLLGAAAALLAWSVACKVYPQNPSTPKAFQSDPILTLGHGSFIGADARPVVPDEAFVLAALEFYSKALRTQLELDHANRPEVLVELDDYQALIQDVVKDRVLANALYIDWLLERGDAVRDAHIEMVNHALRWYYVLKLQAKPVLPDGDNGWWKGLDEKTARELERLGVNVRAVTNAGGPAYRKDCLAAGVPVPEQVLSSDWTNRGVFDKEFISEGSEAELWLWTSDDPPGVCLALPRYDSSNQAGLLGVICLGTQSSKACFFDNPNGTKFPRNQPIPIDQFVGGADLVANGQGTCTDCHAGENPYVVHPEKPAFAGLTNTLRPAAWHDPLVVAQWPHNPGPTNVLAAISSTQQCDSCHTQSYAGRFPQISQALAGYCGTVLGTAIGGSAKRTMPMGGGSVAAYQAHVDELQQTCQDPKVKTEVVDVDLPDDRNFLSPPVVLDPIYACATLVAVRGAVLDAEVQLFLDGVQIGTFVPARNSQQIDFTVPSLTVGQVLKARQVADGTTSDDSPDVLVRDHRVDYPDGLPAPEIDPTLIYECAEVIAVRHVPTAVVTVYSNGADPVVRSTSTGWTAIWPAKRPFVTGDKFTAEISICSDGSALSKAEFAVNAPSTLPAAHFDPSVLFDGQELVNVVDLTNGAQTRLDVASFGQVAKFTTPISRRPEIDVAAGLGRALNSSDILSAHQKLCDKKSTSPPTRVARCPELPAPRIEPAHAGDTFVVVADALPGARIRIYDSGNAEIGDGSGIVVQLSRPLVGGEILTVTQQLGECMGREGFRISVLGKG